ncbi:MAG TPA: aldose epimerase [Acidobacteriota bacterium]|nr:aldose epimerase [Acidobacteriota bacterium]
MHRAVLAWVLLGGTAGTASLAAAEATAVQVLRWSIGQSRFTAAPEAGARLLSWDFMRRDGTTWRVIFPVELPEEEQLALVRGGIPILFPFAGPSETSGRKFAWRDERGVIRPMPMHGFARQSRFELVEETTTGFRARLMPDATARDAYPFKYTFEIRYEFRERSIACELTLRNRDVVRIPWSAGLHPYFSIPWRAGDSSRGYELFLASRSAWRRNGAALVSHPVPRFPRPLSDPDLRTTFWSDLESPGAVFGRAESGECIEVIHDSARFPTASFVIWTEKADVPFYCVEPFMGPTNAAETGVGLYWVAPQESACFRVEIHLHDKLPHL